MNYLSPIIEEEWKVVNIGGIIQNYYYISNLGRLKNIHGQIIKPQKINSGYYIYSLYTGNNERAGTRYKRVLVHRLVKMIFDPIENYNNLTVNHEDLMKFNNYNDNLTWMTQAENNNHKQENLHLYGSNNYKAAFTRDQLIIIINELSKNTPYNKILSILNLPNTDNNRDYIGNIKRGKTHQKEIRDILNG